MRSTATLIFSFYTAHGPVASDGPLLFLPEQEQRRDDSDRALDPSRVLGFSLSDPAALARELNQPSRSGSSVLMLDVMGVGSVKVPHLLGTRPQRRGSAS